MKSKIKNCSLNQLPQCPNHITYTPWWHALSQPDFHTLHHCLRQHAFHTPLLHVQETFKSAFERFFIYFFFLYFLYKSSNLLYQINWLPWNYNFSKLFATFFAWSCLIRLTICNLKLYQMFFLQFGGTEAMQVT